MFILVDVVVKDADGSPIVYENINVVQLDTDEEGVREDFTSDTEITNILNTAV